MSSWSQFVTSFPLADRELEHEVGREPVQVALDGLVERHGGNADELGEVRVDDDPLAPDDQDRLGDSLVEHERGGFGWHPSPLPHRRCGRQRLALRCLQSVNPLFDAREEHAIRVGPPEPFQTLPRVPSLPLTQEEEDGKRLSLLHEPARRILPLVAPQSRCRIVVTASHERKTSLLQCCFHNPGSETSH